MPGTGAGAGTVGASPAANLKYANNVFTENAPYHASLGESKTRANNPAGVAGTRIGVIPDPVDWFRARDVDGSSPAARVFLAV